MVAIVKITAQMVGDVYRDQLRGWNPNVSEARWRRIFQVPACSDHSGYAMVDGSRIVGVIGLLYSERRFRERSIPLCNVHSWNVDSEYRAKSLLLLRPIAGLRDHTITDLTPHVNVVPIMKRIGLTTLDRGVTVLPSLPWKSSPRGSVVHLLRDVTSREAATLSPADLAIFRDHQGIECGHLLMQAGREYCYVVFSTIERRLTTHCLVHYISCPRTFVEHHATIRAHLARESRCSWIVVDSRLLDRLRVPYTFQLPATEKLYRSSQLAPHQIDSLYSEQAILKHSSMQSMRAQLLRKLNGLGSHLRLAPAAAR
jgi:hypothetical protein